MARITKSHVRSDQSRQEVYGANPPVQLRLRVHLYGHQPQWQAE